MLCKEKKKGCIPFHTSHNNKNNDQKKGNMSKPI